jgi:hypothetical protein
MRHRRVIPGVRAAGLVAVAVLVASIGAAPPSSAYAVVEGAVRAAPRCSSGVPGDVNGDGFAEVAVGEPGNAGGRGSVHVFYGSRRGLVVGATGTARNDQYLAQDTPGVPGRAEVGDAFGTSTVLADLNGDGCADLAVGSPGENARAGWVQVFFGSPTGVKTTGVQSLALSGLPGAPGSAPDQELGDTLAAGDLDEDGIDDLTAGVSGLRVGGKASAGGVAVVHGGTTGLQVRRSALLTRDTPGIPGAAEELGAFGIAVATGDFDGDDASELAVGSTNGLSGGSVQLVARTAGGFRGSEPIRPATAGMPGESDRFCAFGFVLAAGDVHGDGRHDLAVADPAFGCHDEETEFGMGAVVLLPGSSSGLTTARSQLWTQSSPGVQGRARLGNVFGESLAMAPLDRGATDDLAIGAPGDTRGGSVTVLRGSPAGLTTAGTGGTRYTQSTAGIPGTAETADSFGDVVTAAFLHSRTQATLVVGVPGEDVGRIADAGSITQLSIGSAGPNLSGSRTITADTPGVQGKARTNERFGDGIRRWG